MKPMTWRQRKAIEKNYADRLQRLNPSVNLTNESGIYVLTRYDEELGLKFAYIGQAVNIMRRLVQHCMEHAVRVDNSIHKRGLYSEKNKGGWKVASVEYCPTDALNERERHWIRTVGNGGYQLYNKTSGGQDGERVVIAETKPTKGYRDGLKRGRENVRRELAPLFAKYLRVEKIKENKLSARMLEKWENFIKGENDNVGEKEETGTR